MQDTEASNDDVFGVLDQEVLVADDIIYFKHIRYPSIIVKEPPFIITILDMAHNGKVIGKFGAYIVPIPEELNNTILPKRIFECVDNMTFSEYNPANYTIKVEKVQTCQQ